MWVFWRSTTFRQAPTASINKALPGKKEKKSQTSSNYKPANVLRCVYDRIYVKLSHSVNKLYGYVLQCLHLFLHWLTSHAQGSQGETRAHAQDAEATRREEISGDPLASRVLWFSRVCAYLALLVVSRRKHRHFAVYLGRSSQQYSCGGERTCHPTTEPRAKHITSFSS